MVIETLLVQQQQDELFGQAYRKVVFHALSHPAGIDQRKPERIRADVRRVLAVGIRLKSGATV